MLTPNDVHQIVGLLSYSFSSEDVDIELGSMVLDKTTDTERDVDITISFKDESDNQISLTGLEVKDHSRPLDVSHVEQLATKLKDMPSVNRRGIVSSSGYTRPAIKKAKAHGIQLYRFEDWDYENAQLDHVKIDFDIPLNDIRFQWQGTPEVIFIPEAGETSHMKLKIEETPVYFENAEVGVMPSNFGDLAKNLSSKIPDEFANNPHIADDTEYSLRLDCNISSKPYILVSGRKVFFPKAIVKGKIRKQITTYLPACKALRKQNYKKPLVACLLYELDNNQLLGWSFYHRDISFINIPIRNRNLNKIKQMKLVSRQAPEQTLSPSVTLGHS